MKEMDLLTALRGMKKVITVQTLTYFLLIALIEFSLFYPDLSERYDLPCQILFTTALAGFAGAFMLQKEEMDYIKSCLKQQPEILRKSLILEYGGALLATVFMMIGVLSFATNLLGNLPPAAAAFFGLVSLATIAWRNNRMFALAKMVLEGKEEAGRLN